MRRAAIWAGLLAVAAATAGAARWPIAPALVSGRLNAAFGGSGPVTWSAPQSATFSVLPWPSVRFVDARLDDAFGLNVMSAPEARVDLSLIDLALGRIAPGRVILAQPTITLDLERPPFSGRLDAADAIAAISELAPLGSVSLTDGVVRVTRRSLGPDAVIENVRGRLDGLKPGARFSVGLSAIWRGKPLVVSGSLDDPRRAARGKPSALRVAISSVLGDLAFNGAATGGGNPGAAGDLAVSSHAPAEAARLFDVTPPPLLGVASVAISGKVKAGPGEVNVDDATVTLAGQTLEGAVRLARIGRRLTVSGSLDAERLALASLIGPPAPLFAPDGRWSAQAVPLEPPRDLDLDLRVSAGRLDIYGIDVDKLAVSALMKDGALTVSLVEATVYGGRLNGELRLAQDESKLRVAARAKLAGADFAAAASDLGWAGLTGKGAAEFAIETVGRSPADWVAESDGRASLELAEGSIAGVNLEEALRRSQRRPLDVAKDMRSGGTAFERASISLFVHQGVAQVVNGALIARGLRAYLQGAVNLGGQSLNLRVNAAQAEPTGAAPPDAAHLSLDIDGPWSNPTVQSVDEAIGAQPGPAAPTP
jgi:AsmA protein